MKLGIIGTAGRKEDGARLNGNSGYWRTMLAISQAVVTVLKPTELVSGGAAYADHVAVKLFLSGDVNKLTLYLPEHLEKGKFKEGFDKFHAGSIANYYHSVFSKNEGFDSLAEVYQAVEKGAIIVVNQGGFKARNTDVANSVHSLLAFTFGNGEELKDGGSLDTWNKFLSRRESLNKEYVNLGDSMPAFHYCLNKKRLYRT
jgi:hypothetical protein